jgi:3-dehydroquinate dehydratase-2
MHRLTLGLLNGPNLNLLGVREPHIYGATTLSEIEARCTALAREMDADVVARQSNREGELIEILHDWRGRVDGVVINPGAFAHTSLALRDAFDATSLPFVEVHISNVYAREPERRTLMLAPRAIGVITGLGVRGYEFGLRALAETLRAQRASDV